MKIATWNVNGIKARHEALLVWLAEAKPDLVCLQEIKSVDDGFPADALQDAGYISAVHGQKGFNGVALLSRTPLEDVRRGLPGDDHDEQSRYIEASIAAGSRMIRVGGLYLPNGNPIGTDKFAYKLAWMQRLEAHARSLLAEDRAFILAGDFNVIPMPVDAARPEAWTEDALYQPESRAAWRRLVSLGLTDVVRAMQPAPNVYTFWDYQAGARQKNHGIRIDHILASPLASDLVTGCGIDKDVRGRERPSDHVPVWVTLGE